MINWNRMPYRETTYKEDFFDMLSYAGPEIAGLRRAVVTGQIDGDWYGGKCCCFKGTIAKLKDCNVEDIEWELSSRLPAEELGTRINAGDTPENNEYSALAVQWIDEFVAGLK